MGNWFPVLNAIILSNIAKHILNTLGTWNHKLSNCFSVVTITIYSNTCGRMQGEYVKQIATTNAKVTTKLNLFLKVTQIFLKRFYLWFTDKQVLIFHEI